MEFLRYGSRIPGEYKWGCCAVDIIQNFNVDPDDKTSIQVVSGDSAMPILRNGENAFLGVTYKEVFDQRLRIGTFNGEDMPNHVFFAVMTHDQLNTEKGFKWLKILKEAGFEFIRATDNSVYTGATLERDKVREACDDCDCDDCYCGCFEVSHVNYIFGLFRNIGVGSIEDPFAPPEKWLSLDSPISEVNQKLTPEDRSKLTKERYDHHLAQWDKIGRVKFRTRKEVLDAGAPVVLAGMYSEYPQEEEDTRKARDELKSSQKASKTPQTATIPWSL